MKKGTMRPVKQVLGWASIILGAGLVLFPTVIMPILTTWKVVIGLALVFLGYLNTKAGSQL